MMRDPLSVLALVGACAISASCGQEASVESRYESTGPQLARWDALPEWEIGSLDDPDQSLVQISRVLIGPEERLYVAQPLDGEIRVYQRDSLLHRIGGKGEGPGEFNLISELGFKEDTIYATDHALKRLSFFDLNGEYLSSIQWSTPRVAHPRGASHGATAAPSVPNVLLDDGTAMVKPWTSPQEGWGPQGEGVQRDTARSPYLRVDRASTVLDTIWVERIRTVVTLSMNGSLASVPCPFEAAAFPALALDGSGVILFDPMQGSDQFRIIKRGPSGDTVLVRPISYRPLPLTEAAVDSVVSRLLDPPGGQASSEPSLNDLKQALDKAGCIPQAHPPVTVVVSGQDGSIWLGREYIGGDSMRWTVLDSDANPLGEVSLPTDHFVSAARRDLVVTTHRDEFGVPYLTGYRIER